jgi:4-alpha-glucanotransferase
LYKWQDKTLLAGIYQLFQIRLRYLAHFYDLIRFDYANGLFVYGIIDLKDNTLDRYEMGPGRPFLEKLIKGARNLNLKIYAEDTGINLGELRNCLRTHHLAGIKIFRFAYNEKRKIFVDMYLKISQYPVNTVAYTTTHDTEPLLAYLEKLSSLEVDELMKKLRLNQPITTRDLA